jgi:hypothetical protein
MVSQRTQWESLSITFVSSEVSVQEPFWLYLCDLSALSGKNENISPQGPLGAQRIVIFHFTAKSAMVSQRTQWESLSINFVFSEVSIQEHYWLFLCDLSVLSGKNENISPQRPQRAQRVVIFILPQRAPSFAKDAMREPFNYLCVFRGLCSGALLTFSLRHCVSAWSFIFKIQETQYP